MKTDGDQETRSTVFASNLGVFITDILEDGQVTDYDITPKDVGERTGDSRKIVKAKVNLMFEDRPRILIEEVEKMNQNRDTLMSEQVYKTSS